MKTKSRLDIPFKIKSVSETGEFEGYGSIFGNKDSYSDIVVKGAFEKSLKSHSEKETLPAMLWQHKMDEPIGIYTEMKEDETGLFVKGRLLIEDDPLAKRAHAHLKAGSITGLSIGYVLEDYEYDKEKGGWLLKEIDLWEISLVTFPANEEARISDVKSALMSDELPQPSLVEKCLRDVGFSRKQSKAFMADGYKALRDAEENEDEVRDSLESLKSIFKK
ncbi:HK97 family phage prohead protease [Psychrosphaera sp. 1_MG-2023]|uniref:HK97 family phage prohead protease n=1 Tax=Psychrosphaera sp. 1_MG-2023 TaxID=3062643 RepID=UPI0026E166DA|nr:HK97 family phage prohead protease [Psychrosphaera sp. 1_MG-2023]MDO6718821.1 HK97 family phage prohead protease [Psychrosphaera sp. 1_MG-2023]